MSKNSPITEDSDEHTYDAKATLLVPQKKEIQEEVYTAFEKVLICVACIAANFAVTYAITVYGPIEQEFAHNYHCNKDTFFWFMQVCGFTQFFTSLPLALLASRYPRYGMQLCILMIIIGP